MGEPGRRLDARAVGHGPPRGCHRRHHLIDAAQQPQRLPRLLPQVVSLRRRRSRSSCTGSQARRRSIRPLRPRPSSTAHSASAPAPAKELREHNLSGHGRQGPVGLLVVWRWRLLGCYMVVGWEEEGGERERVNPPRNGIGDVPPTELRALLLLREWNADGWLIIRLKIQFERYIQIVGYPFHSTPLHSKHCCFFFRDGCKDFQNPCCNDRFFMDL